MTQARTLPPFASFPAPMVRDRAGSEEGSRCRPPGKPSRSRRKTYESLGTPLPGRLNIVATQQPIPGVLTIPDLARFDPTEYEQEVFIIGGAQIYAQTLSRCSDLFLSMIPAGWKETPSSPEFEPHFELAETILRHPDFEVRHYRNRNCVLK
jgi:dihydrofolate reductase